MLLKRTHRITTLELRSYRNSLCIVMLFGDNCLTISQCNIETSHPRLAAPKLVHLPQLIQPFQISPNLPLDLLNLPLQLIPPLRIHPLRRRPPMRRRLRLRRPVHLIVHPARIPVRGVGIVALGVLRRGVGVVAVAEYLLLALLAGLQLQLGGWRWEAGRAVGGWS